MTYRRMKYRLKQRCKANGLPRVQGFNWRPNRCGRPCEQTLKIYQGFVGIPQTGSFDARTLDALFPQRFRNRVYAKANSQLGVHEWPSGSNAGPVLKFIEPFIGRVPTAWCAFFGAWNLVKAGFEKARLWKDVGWVDSWEREAKDGRNRFVKTVRKLAVRRGDFGLADWQGDGNPDHLVIVTRAIGPLVTVHTVEGNVGAYGGSVTKKTRLVTQIHCFVRVNRYVRR